MSTDRGERGIKVAYLFDADLVGNRQNLKRETLVTDVEYADDMGLLAVNWAELTTMLTNPGAQNPAPIQLVPGGEPIEVVFHFQYLGSTVQNDCEMDAEVSS